MGQQCYEYGRRQAGIDTATSLIRAVLLSRKLLANATVRSPRRDVTEAREISSLASFIAELEEGPMGRCVYRGQASDWPLLPAFFREHDEALVASHAGWADFHNVMISRFLVAGFPLLSPEFKALAMDPDPRDLRLVALAQHYGLPTRLLDWTYNPLVALFFAVEGDRQADVANSVLHEVEPAVFIGPSHGFHAAPFGNEILDTPNFDERIAAQQGCFSVFPYPNGDNPPASFFELTSPPKSSRKWSIPHDARQTVKQQLENVGVNMVSVYPGLSSVAKVTWDSRTRPDRVTW